jgi:two-component sensor histidine kinase
VKCFGADDKSEATYVIQSLLRTSLNDVTSEDTKEVERYTQQRATIIDCIATLTVTGGVPYALY